MHNKVSVVTTVYNGEKYIEHSIRSILGQTFEDFEYLIVDDGSTDGTLKKIQHINDPRIRVLRQNNQGQTNALINGIKQANGELIARLDADDYSLPNRLMRQVEYMNSHPKVLLCSSRFEELHQENLLPQRVQFVSTNNEIKENICYFNPFAHSAVMFRRDAYLKVGGYNKNYKIGMDYHLWTRLMEIGEVHNIDEGMTVVRVHNESISSTQSRLTTIEGIKIRLSAYSRFGGNSFLISCLFLKSLTSLLLPLAIKNFFKEKTR